MSMIEFTRPTEEDYDVLDCAMPQHTADDLPLVVFMNPWLDGYARPWPRETEHHETENDDACVPYGRLDAVEAVLRELADRLGLDADEIVAFVGESLTETKE